MRDAPGFRDLPDQKIDLAAAEFRARYASDVRGAMDVEWIAEHRMKLQIVPRPAMLERAHVYAWLSLAGTEIFHDERACDHECELQSLLLHEIGHLILHLPIVRAMGVTTLEAWQDLHQSFSEQTEKIIEYQARRFALRAQMPDTELREVFEANVELALDRFTRVCGPAELYVTERVASHFGVLELRANERLKETRLWQEALQRYPGRVTRDRARRQAQHAGRASKGP